MRPSPSTRDEGIEVCQREAPRSRNQSRRLGALQTRPRLGDSGTFPFNKQVPAISLMKEKVRPLLPRRSPILQNLHQQIRRTNPPPNPMGLQLLLSNPPLHQ